MTSDANLTNPPELVAPTGRFVGRLDFQAWVRRALAVAASQGWREITLADSNFEDWPLGELAVIESLQQWTQSGRKMTVIAHQYDAVIRLHPRFVEWRKSASHIIDARVCKNSQASLTGERVAGAITAGALPSGFWSPVWALHRIDVVRSNGWATLDARNRVQLGEMMKESYRQSSPGFPVSTLGL